jgi:mono/diheme cytochrome c family protein
VQFFWRDTIAILMTLLVIVVAAITLIAASTLQNNSRQIASSTQRTGPVAIEAVPTVPPSDTYLAAGQRNYNTYCAHCHGYAGEGQHPATIDQTQRYGYNLVPAHDDTGHTWQHPDQLLFEVTKYGIRSPLNLYRMTPFDEQLSDDEIFGVIDYMKTFWTEQQRDYQQQLTDEYAERDPEWSPQELEQLYEDEAGMQN